ncbi:hypothetical protein HanIR_Chr15g0783261 [Helianthus annuus]|nr:hypothetical protein HanIR_Chr15g0783261 [Helianthus annuus]
MSGCNPSQVRNICNGTHLESFVNQTVVDEHVRHSKHRDPQPLQFHHHHISLFFYFILFVFSYSYVVITHLSVLIRRQKPYLREQSRTNVMFLNNRVFNPVVGLAYRRTHSLKRGIRPLEK